MLLLTQILTVCIEIYRSDKATGNFVELFRSGPLTLLDIMARYAAHGQTHTGSTNQHGSCDVCIQHVPDFALNFHDDRYEQYSLVVYPAILVSV